MIVLGLLVVVVKGLEVVGTDAFMLVNADVAAVWLVTCIIVAIGRESTVKSEGEGLPKNLTRCDHGRVRCACIAERCGESGRRCIN